MDNTLDKRYKLEKEQILNSKKQIVETPKVLLKSNKINFPITDFSLKELIKEFLKTIIPTIGKENLKLLCNNINNLIIQNKLDYTNLVENIYYCIKNNAYISGYYVIKDNYIYLVSSLEYYIYSRLIKNKSKYSYKEFLKNVLFHEMLHMCSSFYSNYKCFSGFSQGTISKNDDVGNGINEGYTELLLSRFFPKVASVNYVYKYEKEIAQTTEELIGQNKMYNLYFNANLVGLIKELSIYTNINDAKNFIINIDYFQDLLKFDIPFRYKFKELSELNDKINCFLINSYINKLKKENNNDEEIIERTIIFSNKLYNNIAINLNIHFETDKLEVIRNLLKEHGLVNDKVLRR